MTHLSENSLLKLSQIIGNPKANPPIPALVPVCKASWFAGQKGPNPRFPLPIRIGEGRGTFYRSEDIKKLIASV
jgi:prophage regulatory protein